MKEQVNNQKQIDPHTQRLVTKVFASVWYLYNHMEEIYTNYVLFELRNSSKTYHMTLWNAQVIYPWDSIEFSPKSTGTPPHIIILAEMEIMKITSKETREKIINDMTYLTNVRYVGVKGFNTTSSAILGSTKKKP